MSVPGHRQRSQTPAVEGVLHGDDLMPRMAVPAEGILFSRLHGALDRLRPAVGKENPVHAGSGKGFLRSFQNRHIVIQVRRMDHPVYLVFQRLIVRLAAISQGAYRNACGKIQILFPVRVIEIDALAPV